MSELQHQVYEQAKASSTWKYKLGFTCEKCEMKWFVYIFSMNEILTIYNDIFNK
jgi:hypothetical protein